MERAGRREGERRKKAKDKAGRDEGGGKDTATEGEIGKERKTGREKGDKKRKREE